jgi:serine/threonine protein phosphatase 1
MGKIFAIGDIHGCNSKLDTLMEKLHINAKEDTLVFVGDYVDRGPDSKGVVDSILEIRKTADNVICLKGNHELMFLNYYCERRDEELFMHNGGLRTLISYGFMREGRAENLNVPESHMQFFSTLQLYYETDHYIFVHAGLRPGIPLEQQTMDDLFWIRYDFINSPYDFGKTVIFGHTPISYTAPHIEKNKIGIDTGAVFGGKLTCLELPEMILHQV